MASASFPHTQEVQRTAVLSVFPDSGRAECREICILILTLWWVLSLSYPCVHVITDPSMTPLVFQSASRNMNIPGCFNHYLRPFSGCHLQGTFRGLWQESCVPYLWNIFPTLFPCQVSLLPGFWWIMTILLSTDGGFFVAALGGGFLGYCMPFIVICWVFTLLNFVSHLETPYVPNN